MYSARTEGLQDIANEGKDAELNRVLGIIVDIEGEFPELKEQQGFKELVKRIQDGE